VLSLIKQSLSPSNRIQCLRYSMGQLVNFIPANIFPRAFIFKKEVYFRNLGEKDIVVIVIDLDSANTGQTGSPICRTLRENCLKSPA